MAPRMMSPRSLEPGRLRLLTPNGSETRRLGVIGRCEDEDMAPSS
jgi:hypothetical protein